MINNILIQIIIKKLEKIKVVFLNFALNFKFLKSFLFSFWKIELWNWILIKNHIVFIDCKVCLFVEERSKFFFVFEFEENVF